MNILMLTSEYPQPDDTSMTTSKIVEYFVKIWSAQGHRVVVIHNISRFPIIFYFLPEFVKRQIETKRGSGVPDIHTREPLCRIDDNAEIYRLPMNKLVPGKPFSNHAIEAQVEQILSMLREIDIRPDIAIGHWQNPQLPLLKGLKETIGVKTALVFHADHAKANNKMMHTKELLHYIDYIGCRSEYAANAIQKEFELPSKPFICYSGIPQSYLNDVGFVDRTFKHGVKNFIYAGRLIARKNIDCIIRALHEAYDKECIRLNIYGEGGEEKRLVNLVNSLNMLSMVTFCGRVSRETVQDQFSKVDCFTMISNNETFGLVYLEAMAHGCITIASKFGGVDGIIVDGYNGFLCTEGSVCELVEIYRYIQKMTPDELLTMSRNAVETVKNYTDIIVGEKYLDAVT